MSSGYEHYINKVIIIIRMKSKLRLVWGMQNLRATCLKYGYKLEFTFFSSLENDKHLKIQVLQTD